MVATLRQENHVVSHYSIDLQHSLEEKQKEQTILDNVTLKLKSNIAYFEKFNFIAISLTSWTIEYCQILLKMLSAYSGKIILGGYEVTSRLEENLLPTFPRADYFIKGYAEKALKNILADNTYYANKIISEPLEESDLVSPYLTGVLTTASRKIHWETKRGCPYRCGFCEWGNATIRVVDINKERLRNEIELFKGACIDEINILDGTFNFGKHYLDIFAGLLEIENVKITCQAKFENLIKPDGSKFLELCKKAGNRVHLEFGLQTIHVEEMKTIGRQNDLVKISSALGLLKEYKIDYEVSIIYAIPGQTVESFIDTIEFLITQGCKNIKAYPLSIPKNSMMDSKKAEMSVVEGKNRFNVASVISTYSFQQEQRVDMDNIVDRLNNGKLFTDFGSLPTDYEPGKEFNYDLKTPYQWEIKSIEKSGLNNALIQEIQSGYISPTMSAISKEDFRQGLMCVGQLSSLLPNNWLEFINDLLSDRDSLKLADFGSPIIDPDDDVLISDLLNRINRNIIPKKYICKLRISKSRNIYVFREIQTMQI